MSAAAPGGAFIAGCGGAGPASAVAYTQEGAAGEARNGAAGESRRGPAPGKGRPAPYPALLEKALSRSRLNLAETERLLSPRDGEEREALYAAAREARARAWGGTAFSYGFLYLSTYCRNDCLFCSWRRTGGAERYRKTSEEALEASLALAAEGVSLLDLTTGEDPESESPAYQSRLAGLIRDVGRATGLPVMISPGVAPREAFAAYREAGALFYACYQETHSPRLFARLRPGQGYRARWRAKLEARRAGLLVEEGVLCGAGESPRDLARSVAAMRGLGAAQVRAMAYVPPDRVGPGPFLEAPPPGEARARELAMIAAMRLAFPEALIPASLDVEGLAGLAPRILAGANVVTSVVPAGRGLAGVAQRELDIQGGGRSLAAVVPILESLGLRHAAPGEYMASLPAPFRAGRQAPPRPRPGSNLAGPASPPAGQGSLLSGPGSAPDWQGSPPDGEGSPPDGQGSLPNGRGSLPDGRGSALAKQGQRLDGPGPHLPPERAVA